jgi:hypothetical protein
MLIRTSDGKYPKPVVDDAVLVTARLALACVHSHTTVTGAQASQGRANQTMFDLAMHMACGQHWKTFGSWIAAQDHFPRVFMPYDQYNARQVGLIYYRADPFLRELLRWLYVLPRHVRVKQVNWLYDTVVESSPMLKAQEAVMLGTYMMRPPIQDERAKALCTLLWWGGGPSELYEASHIKTEENVIIERAIRRHERRIKRRRRPS